MNVSVAVMCAHTIKVYGSFYFFSDDTGHTPPGRFLNSPPRPLHIPNPPITFDLITSHPPTPQVKHVTPLAQLALSNRQPAPSCPNFTAGAPYGSAIPQS